MNDGLKIEHICFRYIVHPEKCLPAIFSGLTTYSISTGDTEFDACMRKADYELKNIVYDRMDPVDADLIEAGRDSKEYTRSQTPETSTIQSTSKIPNFFPAEQMKNAEPSGINMSDPDGTGMKTGISTETPTSLKVSFRTWPMRHREEMALIR